MITEEVKDVAAQLLGLRELQRSVLTCSSKVESGLKALRDGKRMETNLMTDKEKRLIWTLAYVFKRNVQ